MRNSPRETCLRRWCPLPTGHENASRKAVVQKFPGTAKYSSRKARPKTQKSGHCVIVSTHTSTKASWDFLEQTEDELEDIALMYDDFNARSSMWDQHGNNPRGKTLEEAGLGDVELNPVTTPLPARLGSREGHRQLHWPGPRLPKNSAKAKCGNADTTWKRSSAGGSQSTKTS